VGNNHDMGTYETVSRESAMSSATDEIPVMQRIYNRIWLLALAALVFFFLVYIGWGLLDLLSLPAR
jgi:hypothetical protein